MRFHQAFFRLLLASQLSNGYAFLETQHCRPACSLRVKDSDDFEDLSEGFTDGAELTAEMKAKIKGSHTLQEEASQGGQIFRKLMERAQQGGGMSRPPPSPPMPQYASPQMRAPSFENMSVEEQARMFREMMQQQQGGYFQPPQQSYRPPPPTPNYMGPGVAADGRKIGRNRDADAIVNSADLYFAQLKRDSSVRNMARSAGDEEYANQVFVDPSIKEISMHVNPYMEQAKKEKDLLETSMDEMILPHMLYEEEEQDPSFAGVKYKDLLKQKRKRPSSVSNNSRDVTSDDSPIIAPVREENSVSSPPVSQPENQKHETKVSESVSSVSDSIHSLIIAMEGAIKVYQNVDISARSIALVTVREFLSKLIDLSTQNGATMQANVLILEEESLIKTLEALVLTFKNISPEVRLTMLLSSQVLMQSALVSCNSLLENASVRK